MKKFLIMLLIFLLPSPLLCQTGVPGFMKKQMGTMTGQVITEDGQPVPGGVVSFFATDKGIPPLFANMHRIPDMVGRMGPDGKFSVNIMPGSYYLGAMVITDPGRTPGPPKKGDTFYYARDDRGNLLELTLAAQEKKNVGEITGALPDTFPIVKNLVTIEGSLLKEDGTPFAGGVVLIKTDMKKPRPDFVSERTGEDGTFTLKLPPDTAYYLLGRERAVGRPVPGTYVGTYGSDSPISEGGALPIFGARPAQPAAGRPQVEGAPEDPGKNLPVTVSGKAGETLTGINIKMFKLPVPGEQREKLQGTLGFGDEFKKKMDDNSVPASPSPENTSGKEN